MSLGVVSLLLLASAQTPDTPAAAPSPVTTASSESAAFVGPPPPAPQPPPEVDATGTWKGSTSQGRDIEIEVDTNNVKVLRVSWEIAFDSECVAPDGRLPQRAREGIQVMRYQYPEPVRAGRLKTRMGVGSDLDLLLSGTFGADGTASGDLDLATVGGTRCSGKIKATWKATRR
jgi:hypothetical protein